MSPPTMISAPSEIFAATIETWNTLGPAAAITGYEGVVGFLFAVFFGIMIGIALYCSHTFTRRSIRCLPPHKPCR